MLAMFFSGSHVYVKKRNISLCCSFMCLCCFQLYVGLVRFQHKNFKMPAFVSTNTVGTVPKIKHTCNIVVIYVLYKCQYGMYDLVSKIILFWRPARYCKCEASLLRVEGLDGYGYILSTLLPALVLNAGRNGRFLQ